jgi:integrase
MNTWVLPSLGHLQVQKVDWHDIQRMIDSLDRLSPATVRLCMTLVKAMLQLAVDDKVISENPAASARLVKPASRPSSRTPWSLDEAKVFLASLKPDEDDVDLAFLLMAVTGLRRAEAAGLQWGDIDLDESVLRVQRSVTSVKGELIVSDGGKTANSARIVGLVPEVRELLARHKMREAERFWANGRLFGDESAVFATWTCTPRAPHTFSTRFQAAVKRAGVRPIPLHSLRHLAISQAQMDPQVSQTMLGKAVGHASGSVTSGYTHVDAEVAQKVALSMARVLK